MRSLRRPCRFLFFLSSTFFLLGVFLPTLPIPGTSIQKWRLRFFSRWCRVLLKVLGIRVSMNPLQTERPETRMIVANHVSYLDIPVIAALSPSLFLAKVEVSRWPLIGWIARAMGMLFVRRERLKDRASAINEISAKLALGLNVTVFPEGTTSLTGPLRGQIPYFAGAFRAARNQRVPVEVLYLEYSPLEKSAWLGEDPFLKHFWNLLDMESIQVRIRSEMLPQMPTRDEQVQNYFWSRSWLLGGGHGYLLGLSLKLPEKHAAALVYGWKLGAPMNKPGAKYREWSSNS
jgi:1-acyl-sn-glycerol-3-phosphate acyltransferase